MHTAQTDSLARERVQKCAQSFGAAALALLLTACGAPSRASPPPGAIATAPPPAGPPAARASIASTRRTRSCACSCIGPGSWPRSGTITSSSIVHSSGWVTFAGDVAGAAFYLDRARGRLRGRRRRGARARRAPISRRTCRDGRQSRHAAQHAERRASSTRQQPSLDHRAERRQSRRQRAALEATVRVSRGGARVDARRALQRRHLAGPADCAGATSTLRQTRLGLTPFSVFLGALRVEDRNAGEIRSSPSRQRSAQPRQLREQQDRRPFGRRKQRRRPMPQRRGHWARRRDAGLGQARERRRRRRRPRTCSVGARNCAGSYRPISIESLVQETCGSSAVRLVQADEPETAPSTALAARGRAPAARSRGNIRTARCRRAPLDSG